MRGSLSDFFASTPVKSSRWSVWPPDFDPSYIEFYADKPDAPEVVECYTCAERARCRADRFARPDCSESELGARWKSADDPAGFEQTVLNAFASGPATMYDLEQRTGVKYGTLRHYVERLRASGKIVFAGTQRRRGGRNGSAAYLYALGDATTEAKPIPAPAPKAPRIPKGHAALRVAEANNQRVLTALREQGAQSVTDLALALDLERSTIYDRLKVLEKAGLVRDAGVIERRSEAFHGRRFKVQLWEIVEE